MPMFTVLIPTYNRAGYIGDTLESVLAQTFTDYEIIVVDDGSTDGTREILEKFAAKLPCLRVFAQEHAGQGAARAEALRHARGDYIACLDSDDLWFPWTLATFAAAIQRTGRPSLVMGSPVRFRHAAELASSPAGPLKLETYGDYFCAAHERHFVGGGACAILRESLLAVGGFCQRDMNATDLVQFMRLGTSPGYVRIADPPTLGYRQHADNISGASDRVYDAMRFLCAAELAGDFPGGKARRRQRRATLCHHLAHASYTFRKARRPDLYLPLYLASARFHFEAKRFKYLLASPLVCAAMAVMPALMAGRPMHEAAQPSPGEMLIPARG